MDDEQQIRDLIHRWADAVHTGDMAGVLAHHAEDVVMFDVPPPHRGVRGLAAYRETWPGFFAWQASGASFAIEELDVTAGADVAFAHALLVCGTPGELERDPGLRLRLTVGLRRVAGEWVLTHEHHSFPDRSDPEAGDAVRGILEVWSTATRAKDLDAIMEHIADDVVSVEQDGTRHDGADAVREVCRAGLEHALEVGLETTEVSVVGDGALAVCLGLDDVHGVEHDGHGFATRSWATRVFTRRHDRWLLTHQHLSAP